MKLAELVKTKRTKMGLTMRQLEARSGVHNSIIAHIESGRTDDPKFSTVARVCRALKIKLSSITPANEDANDATKDKAPA